VGERWTAVVTVGDLTPGRETSIVPGSLPVRKDEPHLRQNALDCREVWIDRLYCAHRLYAAVGEDPTHERVDRLCGHSRARGNPSGANSRISTFRTAFPAICTSATAITTGTAAACCSTDVAATIPRYLRIAGEAFVQIVDGPFP